MDWAAYKTECDRGDVLSRWLLEQTAALLVAAGEEHLGEQLTRLSQGARVPKPADHKGDAVSDFFVAALAHSDVATILRVVRAFAAAGERRLPDGRGLTGMTAAWQEYLDWLDGTHPRSPLRSNGAL